jgi:hypothetical protein
MCMYWKAIYSYLLNFLPTQWMQDCEQYIAFIPGMCVKQTSKKLKKPQRSNDCIIPRRFTVRWISWICRAVSLQAFCHRGKGRTVAMLDAVFCSHLQRPTFLTVLSYPR